MFTLNGKHYLVINCYCALILPWLMSPDILTRLCHCVIPGAATAPALAATLPTLPTPTQHTGCSYQIFPDYK